MGMRMNNMGKMMNNPQQRNIYLLILALVLITLGVGFFVATRNKSQQIASGSQIEAIPGGIKSTPGASTNPDYVQSVKNTNDKNAAQAMQSGNSFVPTITATTNSSSSALDDIAKKQQQEVEEKTKKEAEEKQRMDAETKKQQALVDEQQAQQVQQQAAQQMVNNNGNNSNFNNGNMMQQQQVAQKPKKYNTDDYMLVASLSSNWGNKEPSSEYDFAKQKGQNNSGSSGVNNGNGATQNTTQSNTSVTPYAKAGTIYNAVIETGVNSDEESPVLAKIVSGPLKGTRLIGTFKNLGEKVAVVFTTANIPALDKTVKFNGYAIDSNTSRTALADDVNHHYFLRYGVLLATSFISGYAQAIGQSGATTSQSLVGTTTTNPTYTTKQLNQVALGQVGTQVASDVNQHFQGLKPTIVVNSGTAIGILLMDDLIIK